MDQRKGRKLTKTTGSDEGAREKKGTGNDGREEKVKSEETLQ